LLGLVGDTVQAFLERNPDPIGFIAHDLDYYSSTKDAFGVFEADERLLFPRILCYFDDVLGYPWGDVNGERLAIIEFNAAHEERKIAQLHGMKFLLPSDQFNQRWVDSLYLAHVFDHSRYGQDEGVAITRRLDLP